MGKLKLVLKVVLPSILYILLAFFTKISLVYSTLTFGLIIGVTNINLYKINSFFGVLLSISFSFVSFVLAYLSLLITLPIFSSLGGEKGGIVGSNISMYVIAPLLLFYLYKFVFNIPKTKFTKFTILFSIALLILQSYFFVRFSKIENNTFNPQTMWQVIVALALQLILYQNEILKKEK